LVYAITFQQLVNVTNFVVLMLQTVLIYAKAEE